jgi:hypothetical protein
MAAIALTSVGAPQPNERFPIRRRRVVDGHCNHGAGRTGGRPPKLTEDDIEVAKALLANPDIGVTEIAHRLGVSQATLDASLVPAPAVTAMEAKRNAIKSGSLKVPVEDRQPT